MKPFVLLLATALLAGCSRPAAPDSAPSATLAVRTATVGSAVTPLTQPVAGTLRPVDRATVAARVMGTVGTARLAVGQTVVAGEVLVTLQAAELTARVEQARASLAQAERDFTRETTLEAKGAAAAEAVRNAADRLRLARAAVAEAAALLTYTEITAPFAGVITGDYVNPGDLAAPGQPLFELEGTDRLRAEVAVPESLAELPPGTAVIVRIDDIEVTGTLVELSPAADPGTRSRLAKIDLPAHPALRSGRFVRVLWPAGTTPQLTVPADAVTQFGQMERVFVVTDGHAHLRLVKTGRREADRLVILAGLDAGETVILNPPATLRDGQAVTLLP